MIKQIFAYETYLDDTKPARRIAVARFRSSSHRLNVELGRYTSNKTKLNMDPSDNNTFFKRCRICCCNTDENLWLLSQLPFSDIIIEDELHVLRCCPPYEHLRQCLSNNLKTTLWNDDTIDNIFDDVNTGNMADFIFNITRIRFPDTLKN